MYFTTYPAVQTTLRSVPDQIFAFIAVRGRIFRQDVLSMRYFLYKVRNRMEQLIRFVKNSCVLENFRPVPSYIYPRQGTTIKQRYFLTERLHDLSEAGVHNSGLIFPYTVSPGCCQEFSWRRIRTFLKNQHDFRMHPAK